MSASTPSSTSASQPLVEMRGMTKSFGGVVAVDNVDLSLQPGEVVGLLGHNGAGKSTLIKLLSGALKADSGEIRVQGQPIVMDNPRKAKDAGIETIYQNLALAENLDAAANLFLGREILTRFGFLDEVSMENETRKLMKRINPNFTNFVQPVHQLSGGQRQSVAIARALYFDAKVLIMDEPTAALGPQETEQVSELIRSLKREGIGIFLISHDIHDVYDLSDRFSVLKNGRNVGTIGRDHVTKDELLGMVIMGNPPAALADAAAPAG